MTRKLAILGAAALLLLSACSSSAAPAAMAGGSVDAALTDTTIALAPATVTGGSVAFSLKNTGSVVHSIVVIKTNLAHDKIPADAADPSKADERGSVGASGDITVGQTKALTLNLTPGKYVVICNIPAHYIVGMHTALTVQ